MRIIFILLATIISIRSFSQAARLEDGKLDLEHPVPFKTGSAELTDEGKDALKSV